MLSPTYCTEKIKEKQPRINPFFGLRVQKRLHFGRIPVLVERIGNIPTCGSLTNQNRVLRSRNSIGLACL